jgi:hypothetical protein
MHSHRVERIMLKQAHTTLIDGKGRVTKLDPPGSGSVYIMVSYIFYRFEEKV